MKNTRRRTSTDPTTLAPAVDRAWAESFVVEQRLLGVPGERIGDALVTVESHVRESDESAQEAFGDPRDYARSLAPGVSAPPLGARTVASLILGLAGMLLTLLAFPAWLGGTPVGVSGGLVVVGVILTVLMTLLLVAPSAALRLLVDHRRVAMLAPVVLIAGFVAVLLAWRTDILTLPAAPVGALGLVLVAVSSVLVWVDHEDDRVTAPGQGRRTSTAGRLGSALLTPALVLAMATLMYATHLLA